VRIYIAGEQTAMASSGLALNSCSHLALTYNGTVEQLYVNGALVASRSQSGTVQTSTGVLHIGGDSVWGEYFLGVIDEIRIYTRALSAAEIHAVIKTAVPASQKPDITRPSVAIRAPPTGSSHIAVVTLHASPA